MTTKQIIILSVLAVACLAVNRKAIMGLFSSSDETVYEDAYDDHEEGAEPEGGVAPHAAGAIEDILGTSDGTSGSEPGTKDKDPEAAHPATSDGKPEPEVSGTTAASGDAPASSGGSDGAEQNGGTRSGESTQDEAVRDGDAPEIGKLLGHGVQLVKRPRRLPLDGIDPNDLPFFDKPESRPETEKPDDVAKERPDAGPLGPTPEELAAQRRAAALAAQMKKLDLIRVRAIVMSRRGGSVRIGGLNLRSGATVPGTLAIIKKVERTGVTVEVMGEERQLHLASEPSAAAASADEAAATTPATATTEAPSTEGSTTGSGPVGSVIKAPERTSEGGESSSSSSGS